MPHGHSGHWRALILPGSHTTGQAHHPQDLFPIDLFIMPLPGYDVILGTQWLSALGPILWDFGARAMSFQRRR